MYILWHLYFIEPKYYYYDNFCLLIKFSFEFPNNVPVNIYCIIFYFLEIILYIIITHDLLMEGRKIVFIILHVFYIMFNEWLLFEKKIFCIL